MAKTANLSPYKSCKTSLISTLCFKLMAAKIDNLLFVGLRGKSAVSQVTVNIFVQALLASTHFIFGKSRSETWSRFFMELKESCC